MRKMHKGGIEIPNLKKARKQGLSGDVSSMHAC